MRLKTALASSLLVCSVLVAACDRSPLLDPTGAGGGPGAGANGSSAAGTSGGGAGAGANGSAAGTSGGGGGAEAAGIDAGGCCAVGPGQVADGGYTTKLVGDPTADPNCGVSPASYQDYVTEADLERLLVRRWKRCIAPQFPGEDVGVEFTADGHYYPLTNGPDGSVVRRTGVDYERTWKYFPVGSTDPFFGGTTTRAEMLLGGVLTDAPKFTNDPRQLRILFSPVPGKYLPLDP